MIIVLSVITYFRISGAENSASAANLNRLASGVVMSTGGRSTIEFKTQNGRNINSTAAEVKDIPHLVLKRNGQLTAPEQRTLVVELFRIQVPYPGVNVTLNIETQHEERYLNGAENSRIPVWNESQWISNPEENTIKELDAIFTHEFGENITTEYGTIDTPTDYFRYDISVTDQNGSNVSPTAQYSTEYAFLMENQWVVELPQVRELEFGAAPDELVVYYTDMFNYERDPFKGSSRLHRNQVQGFVSNELVPAMLASYWLQSEVWGFAWYSQWTSYRSGIDSERLSVALTDPGVWYHGWAPGSAHSGISISTSSRSYASYDTLLDGMMSAFHHELFHNHQRGINLHLGGDGDVSGEGNALSFFTEGTALLASSVAGQPVEFASTRDARDYLAKANGFIAGDEFYADGLNTSYNEVDVYAAAVYWRFLHDQCGGMDVIRRTLEVLYSLDDPIASPDDLVKALPAIMDRVLASSETATCPFRSYEESLVQFATAIYALRLGGGRCGQAGSFAGCGFNDPQNVYKSPAVDEIIYSGETQRHFGEIGTSFGIDFVEVILNPIADGQPLSLVISADQADGAELHVLALSLVEGKDGRLQPLSQEIAPGTVLADQNGHRCLSLREIDTEAFNRLGLVITRVDSDERADSLGAYAIDVSLEGDC
jgi:hypothetical protein